MTSNGWNAASPYDIVGIVGVVGYVVAYCHVQLFRQAPDSLVSFGLNLLAPACVLFSLSHDFNLAAFLGQVAWVAVTVTAIIRRLLGRNDDVRPERRRTNLPL